MSRLPVLLASALLVGCSDAAFDVASTADDAEDVTTSLDAADGGVDAAVDSAPGPDASDAAPSSDATDALVSDARDLCTGPSGPVADDSIVVDPNPVKLGNHFGLCVLSKRPLPELRLAIGSSYCAGGAGLKEVSAGPGCLDWHAVCAPIATGAAPITAAGTYSLTIFVNNPGPAAPCTMPYDRVIKGSVQVVP